MSKIQSYSVEMRPYSSYGGNLYEVKVLVNGQKRMISTIVATDCPYNSEFEILNKITSDIIRELREEEKYWNCCCCCKKKCKCQKY